MGFYGLDLSMACHVTFNFIGDVKEGTSVCTCTDTNWPDCSSQLCLTY